MELSVRNAEKSLNKKNSIICQDSADRFFKDLSEEEKNRLPEYSGDLLLVEHSAGSLTSQAIMKRWNRKNELLADAAERASLTAWLTGGLQYPGRHIAKAWERVIGSQMHDILPGTCTPDAYTYSNNDEVVALNSFSSVLTHAAEKMAENLDTEAEGTPLIIYNPLSFEREDLVEAIVPISSEEKFSVYDSAGKNIKAQIITGGRDETHIIFPAKTPSLSWNVYNIQKGEAPRSNDTTLTAEETPGGLLLENHIYRVRINREGFVNSIFDKIQNIEILSGKIHYELLKEKPTYFPAWNMDWRDRKKKPKQLTGILKSVKITEQGPVRVSVEITRKLKASTFTQKISLSTGSSGNRVEFTEKIDWNLSGYSLKAAFPLKAPTRKQHITGRPARLDETTITKKSTKSPPTCGSTSPIAPESMGCQFLKIQNSVLTNQMTIP